jgi:hypothetical protein
MGRRSGLPCHLPHLQGEEKHEGGDEVTQLPTSYIIPEFERFRTLICKRLLELSSEPVFSAVFSGSQSF